VVSYYTKVDNDAYTQQHAAWQTSYDQIAADNAQKQADYQAAHDAWVTAGSDPETEPQPPVPTVSAPEPEPPTITYERTDCARGDVETIQTMSGPALIVGPRVIVTGTNGQTFAMSDEEFSVSFVEVTP
jgi:hypothetical protein